MTRLTAVFEKLNERRKCLAILTATGLLILIFLIPVIKTAWYIATVDLSGYTPHKFKKCPPLNEGFVIDEKLFTVDKQIWFCFNEQVPKKTYISEENTGRIDPIHETEDVVIFFLESSDFASNWKLLASN